MNNEEKKPIVHFDTFEGFQARLDDGTISETGNYIVFIKDQALFWVKGTFYTGPKALSIPKYVKDVIVKDSTLKFTVTEWDEVNKVYTDSEQTFPIATPTEDGLMSKEDKIKVDKLVTDGDGTKYLSDNGTYNLVEDEIIKLPSQLFGLNDTSTSDEIFEVFGGKETLLSYVKNNKKKTFSIYNSASGESLMQTTSLYTYSSYTDDNNFSISFAFNIVDESEGIQIEVTDNVAHSQAIHMTLAKKEVTDSLPNNIVYSIKDFTNNANSVTLNYGFNTKQSDGRYANSTNASKEIPAATASKAGVMTAADKTKLDGISITDDAPQDSNYYARLNGNWAAFDQAVLFKNNTYEYTPTSDYHPATKKYVDDSISTKINWSYIYGDEDLNELSLFPCVRVQSMSVNATLEKHYPLNEAGVLFSAGNIENKCNQVYTTHNSNKVFTRGAGVGGTFTDWEELGKIGKIQLETIEPIESNINLSDASALSKIIEVFGSKQNFINIVKKSKSGKRFYFEIGNNVIELGSTYSYSNDIFYDLSFIYTYYSGQSFISKRVLFRYTTNETGDKAIIEDLGSSSTISDLQNQVAELQAALNSKASQASLDTLSSTVDTKASQASLNSLSSTVDTKASQSSLDSLSTTVAAKANSSDVYTKTEINNKGYLTSHQDISHLATKTEVNNSLSGKANSNDVYTKTEVNNSLAGKADSSTVSSLSSTVSSLSNTVSGKANSSDVYTKTEINNQMSGKASTSDVSTLSSQVSSKASQSDLNSVSSRVSTIEGQYVKSDNIRNLTKKTAAEYSSITKDANTMYAVVD